MRRARRSSQGDDPFRHCVTRPYWLRDRALRDEALHGDALQGGTLHGETGRGFNPHAGPAPDRRGADAPPPPARADLVVVGSGYTGLAAAVEAARGGMSVLVLDRGGIGAGCSTRNGGQVSDGIKPDLAALAARHGAALADRVRAEGQAALDHVKDLVAAGGIDCDLHATGHYVAAHTPRAYAGLVREAEAAAREGRPALVPVPRERQHEELGSAGYFGGAVVPDHAAVDPARLHAGLLDMADGLGVVTRGRCEATHIARDGGGFTVQAGGARIAARHVLVATNGYSGPLSPWLQRRVIPIGSYMLATEPLAPGVAAQLIPKGRMITDTRRVVIYVRLSPDGTRLIFGGRAALAETDPMRSLPRLYRMMLDMFPGLAGVGVSHAWNGFVAYTFDHLPHTGVREGVHYAMGYCGSGIALSLFYGMRAGQRILGRPEGITALDGLAFRTRPLYGGRPWFLAPSILGYRIMDRLGV